MSDSKPLSESQHYENRFVPDSFAEYFTDNRFLKSFKYIFLFFLFILFVGFTLFIAKKSLFDLTTSHVILFSLFGLGAYILNEGYILQGNVRSMESFVTRDLKIKGVSVESLVTWQHTNGRFAGIFKALIIAIFVLSLSCPYIDYKFKELAAYTAANVMFAYAVLKLLLLCQFFDNFHAFLIDAYKVEKPFPVAVRFYFKSAAVKAVLVGVAFFAIGLLFRTDSPPRIFESATSAGCLFFIGSGIYHNKLIFRQIAKGIDGVRRNKS